MSSYARKRKRPFGTRYAPQRAKKTLRSTRYGTYPTFPKVVPGFTRTGGYYGRYASARYRVARSSELKFFDTTLGAAIDSTGEVLTTGGQLCLIPQGVTESTRIGRKCVIKNITIRGTFYINSLAAVSVGTALHMFVVLDKQCNGAAAAVTDVMTGTAFDVALRNLANSERFVVLKHFVLDVGAIAGVSTVWDQVCRSIMWNKKCNIPLEFSSTTGAITEIKSNNIFIMAGAAFTDDVWAFQGKCRLRYSDN